ncbi:hypothetical protein C8R43DRAFT_170827 [Mycena crocata]|nr:hypothetical protein C8R43DRAFT_170827 [Mycena crocata]
MNRLTFPGVLWRLCYQKHRGHAYRVGCRDTIYLGKHRRPRLVPRCSFLGFSPRRRLGIFQTLESERLDNVFEPIMIPLKSAFRMHSTQCMTTSLHIVSRHPSEPSRWRVYGRQDDQIMLSTGENVNPLPMESILSEDKHIGSVLLFGFRKEPATCWIVG